MLGLFKRRTKNTKGFTLIELIVVIAILGMLAVIALPRFADMRVNAEAQANETTAISIVNAAEVYFQDTGTEPDATNLVADDYLREFPAAGYTLTGSIGVYQCTYPVPTGADARFDGTVGN
ncbi:MAG TPA: type II secretion system protein [Patescibacteria group bacterium]|nr:type II secretion system protein [Patescibacteria group bacterium]